MPQLGVPAGRHHDRIDAALAQQCVCARAAGLQPHLVQAQHVGALAASASISASGLSRGAPAVGSKKASERANAQFRDGGAVARV